MAWTKHRSGKAWLRHLKPLPAVALTKLEAVLTELLPCFVLESRSLSHLGLSVIAKVPWRHGRPWDAGVSKYSVTSTSKVISLKLLALRLSTHA